MEEDGKTPLHYAAENGKDKVIKYLLDHQADVNLKDKVGQTPLHFAAAYGYYEIVKVLLNHQADFNLSNKDGKDALALSVNSEVIQLLINAKKLEEDKVLSQKIEAAKKEAEEKSKRQEEERKRNQKDKRKKEREIKKTRERKSVMKEAEATRIKLEKEAKEEALKNERLGNVKKLKTNIANKVPSISIISSTHEVTEWAAQIIGEDNSKLLRRNEIDGEILMSLTEDDLMKTVGLTLGPARKLVNKIKELKAVQTPSSPSLAAGLLPSHRKTFTESLFKQKYKLTNPPQYIHNVFTSLESLIMNFCKKKGIIEDYGKNFFDSLYKESLNKVVADKIMEDIPTVCTLLWTSAIQLNKEKEFCSILNELIRTDDEESMPFICLLCRGINSLCCNTRISKVVWPENHTLYRGGGLPHQFQSFFEERANTEEEEKKKFRAPMYLATSVNEQIAKKFCKKAMEMGLPPVLWEIFLDEANLCYHANYITKSNVESEREFLFAPYSVFTVVSVEFVDQPTLTNPHHRILLKASPDNSLEDENLPSSPWN